jgi:hypothetical protein
MHKIKWPCGNIASVTLITLAAFIYIAVAPPYSFSVRGMHSIGKPCRAVEQVNPITIGPCLGELDDAKLKKTLRISYGLDTTSWPRLDGAMLITYPPGKSHMTEYGVWTTPVPVFFVVGQSEGETGWTGSLGHSSFCGWAQPGAGFLLGRPHSRMREMGSLLGAKAGQHRCHSSRATGVEGPGQRSNCSSCRLHAQRQA